MAQSFCIFYSPAELFYKITKKNVWQFIFTNECQKSKMYVKCEKRYNNKLHNRIIFLQVLQIKTCLIY